MVEPAPPPHRNRLLASLPEAEFRVLEPKLQYMRLPLGKRLYEPGEALTHVYFPTYGIISVLYVNESGASTGLTVVGCEGLVGLALLLGVQVTTIRAVVQAAGHAYRLPAMEAKARFAEGGQFQLLTLRFAHALISQVSQTAFCNLHHSVEQQLCRRLLLCLDRLRGNEMQMTHEQIACTLGVRRQGVTEAAKKLEKRRIIAYFRGRITVLDRHALEQSVCECYRIVKSQSDV